MEVEYQVRMPGCRGQERSNRVMGLITEGHEREGFKIRVTGRDRRRSVGGRVKREIR